MLFSEICQLLNTLEIPTMRQRLIDSICAMFNEYHGNAVSPDWLLELQHNSTDEELIVRLSNWRANYPELWQRHGIYVM